MEPPGGDTPSSSTSTSPSRASSASRAAYRSFMYADTSAVAEGAGCDASHSSRARWKCSASE
ncbi:hypothetical protein [Melittangium boletus]|uniref:hypothetical protein n=1 Tax=Melittangium boletus TaxID=83453 RepID=UPI003DA6C3A4